MRKFLNVALNSQWKIILAIAGTNQNNNKK